MKKGLILAEKVGVLIALFYFCKVFSYELVQPARHTPFQVLLVFAALGLLHAAAFLVFTAGDKIGDSKYRLHSLLVFAAVVGIRAWTSLFEVTIDATAIEAGGYVLMALPLILSFHLAVHVLLKFTNRYMQNRKTVGDGFEGKGKRTVFPS